jgi:hypothetical protein
MTDPPPNSAPDLFDGQLLEAPVAHLGAVSPLTQATPDEREYLSLRWRAAGIAGAIAVTVGFISHFPPWAIAVAGVVSAGMSLWRLSPWASRAWLIAVGSFFFAQATTIFINVPFTWPMRFAFCAVLLSTLTVLRVRGDE